MTEVRENGATSGAGLLAVYAYDDLGRRTTLTRGNGTVTSYSYDAVSRLSELAQNLNGSANDVTFGYAYNPANEIASNTRSNDAYSFTLANANVAGTANGLNQLTGHGGASVTHDANGNVNAIGSATYGYSAENRMATASTMPGGYVNYDPVGRLGLIYDPADPAGISVRQYSGHALMYERTYGGAIRRRYVYGAGQPAPAEAGEPLVWYEGSGLSDRRWLHADERGSIIAVSDGSGNLVGSINRYDDYGSPQGGAITGRFGYTGQAWIPEIGMYDYRARIYNPAMGRFMQSDPIGYEGGMNLYAYVGNNPVNFTDPTGLQCDGCEITVTGARPRSSGVLVGIGGAGRLQLDMPIESGEGGSGLAEDGQDITVTGRRLRTVKVFPNSNGVFECRFIGGNIVTIGFQNTSGTNGAYVNLSSYPAGPEGQQILQVVNPGSNPFHQSARSHVFWFSSIDIDMVARTPSSSGIYHHLLFGRRNEAPVASGQPYFNITVRTNGGWGTCGAF